MNRIDSLVAGDFCPIGRLLPLLVADSVKRHAVAAELSPLVKTPGWFIANLECPLMNAIK
jgi:hypothetical protein